MKPQMFMICMLVVMSCSSHTNIQNDLNQIQSRAIQLDSSSYVIVNEQHILDRSYFDCNLKMVAYTDQTSCGGCVINKLYRWGDLIEWSEQYDGALKFYFIFNPPKGENIRMLLKGNVFDYPMLLDSLGEFERLNPHLPKNKAMHTFLLDEDNNVVLVGNPLHNPKIERMFKEIVEEKLGDN